MTPSRHRRSERSVQRRGQFLVIFAVIFFVIAGASVATRVTSSAPPLPVALGEVASPAAQSSSYTCGGLGEAAGASHGVILLANDNASARTVSIELFNDTGHRATSSIALAARSTGSVDPGTLLTGGSWVSAIVNVSGGDVGVVEQLQSGNSSVTPCAATTSSNWNFVGGSTQVNQTYDISLVNPTAASAVVNTSFLTESGLVAPQNSQGVVVTAHSAVVLPVLSLLPHVANLGTVVQTSQGSIVAFASQVAPSPNGASVTIGQPGLSTSVVVSRGVASAATQGAILVANPTPQAQTVVIRLRLPSGVPTPETQVIAPYATFASVTNPSTRIPTGDVFSARVTTTGPGVVVALQTIVPGAASGGWGTVITSTPSLSDSLHWLLFGGLHVAPLGVSMTNTSSQPVTIHAVLDSGSGASTVPSLDGLTVPADTSVRVPRSVLIALAGASIDLTATGSISISEDLAGGAAPSIGNLVALPIAGT